VKEKFCTPGTNDSRKSDNNIVPEKPANKGVTASAEQVEGRTLTEGNTSNTAAVRTQGRVAASTGLDGVRRKAQQDKEARFNNLFHHITPKLLTEGFYGLKKNAAAGVDKVTWHQYKEGLAERIAALNERLHVGSYRAQPVRRSYISKADGRKRPLGVTALEDKIVQQATATILNQIYETDFMGFSYGFREKRSQHNALDALYIGISRCKINYILDADISGFFDQINHEWLLKFIGHRVADRRMLRLIRKWLKVGVVEEGKRSPQEIGTPQGSVISPVLANVYLHYAQDLWAQQWRNRHAVGDVIIVRYADDTVVGFQYKSDAETFLKELTERMGKFGLELHPVKTRLIEFGRFAESNRRKRGEGKPETFDFLGFTHSCSKTRNGKFTIRRKTIKKRFVKKCKEVKQELKERMHDDVKETGKWLNSVIRGYQNYYAVPGNMDLVKSFYDQTTRAWLHTLRRRSHKGQNYSWKRFEKLIRWLIPRVRIAHPYPNQRFQRSYPR
jgi:group II intron reverse transcriptase/maturase